MDTFTNSSVGMPRWQRLCGAVAGYALVAALCATPAAAQELSAETTTDAEGVPVACVDVSQVDGAQVDDAQLEVDAGDAAAGENAVYDESCQPSMSPEPAVIPVSSEAEAASDVTMPDATEVGDVPEAVPCQDGEEGEEAQTGEVEDSSVGEVEDEGSHESTQQESSDVDAINPVPAPSRDTSVAVQAETTAASTTSGTTASTLSRPANGTYVIKMDGTQALVLSVKDSTAKAGSNVVAATYTGKSGQKWVVVYDTTRKRYRLFVSGTSRKLALGAKKSGTTVNVCVVDAKKASLRSILWTFVCGKDGAYRLANAAYTGKRLDVAGAKVKKGANVIIASRRTTGDTTQRYVTYNAAPKVKAGKAKVEGSYNALLEDNTKVCVGVKGASVTSGANVLVSASSNDTTQRLYFERDAKGFYSVWIVGSGKVLDVKGASVLPGANVQQATNTQADNQKWAVVAKANGDGTYTVTLRNKATGLFLGAAKARKGSNLVGVDASDASKLISFRLRVCDMLDAGIYEIKPTATSGVSLNVAHALADNSKRGSLILYTDKDSLSERFELVDAEGDNVWRVRTASSGGWVTWNGGASVVQAGKGSDGETGRNTWRLTFENGGFSLLNVASGKALEMKDGSKKSGTKIVAADPTGQAAQIFTFETSSLFGGRYVALQDTSGKRAQVGSTNVATVKLAKAATYLAQMLFLEQNEGGWRLRDYQGRYVTTTSTKAKTDVVTKTATGKKDQLWHIGIFDGGKVSFTNVASGLALVAGSTKPQLGQDESAGAGWTLVDRTVDAMKERIAQVAIHFAEHDDHGYSQPNRGLGAKEVITVQDGTEVTISSADVDCSELVRQCANAVIGFDIIEYMWTGNQDEMLLANGFERIAYSASEVKRGDILWRYGHTGVALSSKQQAEASMDEYGGIYGYSQGDQTGREVAINPLGYWTYIYRYVG